ncbi:MAG: MBOAT family protein [Verrucomicrobiota bacterium]
MTEYTDNYVDQMGVLFYDGSCRICVRWAERLRCWFAGRLECRPFVDGGVEEEMCLRLADGREFGGADAVRVLAGRLWWGWPFYLLAYLPGVLPLMRVVYQKIASGRHCSAGACGLDAKGRKGNSSRAIVWMGVLSLVWLVTVAYLVKDLPAWGMMWCLAGAQFLAFKVMVLSRVREGRWWQRMVFLFAWPGMDALTFFAGNQRVEPVKWKPAVFFIILAVALVTVLSGRVENPVLAGWVGMLAVISFLHLGVFALLAKFWQSRGYGARAIMEEPWRAVSLTDFWGRRWNRAFSDVAREMVFRPLSRKWGVIAALVGGFVFSGIAHEWVITVPAGGGYGLALLYFVVQAAGVMMERCFALQGAWARVWTWLVVLGPAYGLFSPVFMSQVINPFMQAVMNLIEQIS